MMSTNAIMQLVCIYIAATAMQITSEVERSVATAASRADLARSSRPAPSTTAERHSMTRREGDRRGEKRRERGGGGEKRERERGEGEREGDRVRGGRESGERKGGEREREGERGRGEKGGGERYREEREERGRGDS